MVDVTEVVVTAAATVAVAFAVAVDGAVAW